MRLFLDDLFNILADYIQRGNLERENSQFNVYLNKISPEMVKFHKFSMAMVLWFPLNSMHGMYIGNFLNSFSK